MEKYIINTSFSVILTKFVWLEVESISNLIQLNSIRIFTKVGTFSDLSTFQSTLYRFHQNYKTSVINSPSLKQGLIHNFKLAPILKWFELKCSRFCNFKTKIMKPTAALWLKPFRYSYLIRTPERGRIQLLSIFSIENYQSVNLYFHFLWY